MFPEVGAAVVGFRQIYIGGIPFLLRQNETSFLSFVCVVSATDALAGYFSLTHASPQLHLQLNPAIGDYFVSDERFFDDMRSAAEKYFSDLQADIQLQSDMLSRLRNTVKGGAIFIRV